MRFIALTFNSSILALDLLISEIKLFIVLIVTS